MNDTERLDFLQGLLDEGGYTKKCILRMSEIGRGFRLSETSRKGAVPDVRQAIDNFMQDHSDD